MFDHWIYDSASWCEFCLPVPTDSPDVADGSGEQDTPAHCCECHRPLEHSLTTAGVAYAIDALLGYLKDPGRQATGQNNIMDGTFQKVAALLHESDKPADPG